MTSAVPNAEMCCSGVQLCHQDGGMCSIALPVNIALDIGMCVEDQQHLPPSGTAQLLAIADDLNLRLTHA